MKISLIITSLNSKKYIAKAIKSFVLQDFEDKELIIFDANSKDGTHEIIDFYQKKHPKSIKWIKEDDKNISQARNKALKHVTGDLIGFLGADDFLDDNFFKNMSYYVKKNPDFDVIYFNSYTVGDNSSYDASAQIKVTCRNLIKHCPIGSGESFYYKKEIFDKFKFNENNLYSMDYELNFEICSSKKSDGGNYQFFPVNIISVFNGSFSDSISVESSKKQRLETIAVQLKYTKSCVKKAAIIFRKKKFILKNLAQFLKIKKKLNK